MKIRTQLNGRCIRLSNGVDRRVLRPVDASKLVCGRGSPSGPGWGAYSAPPARSWT